MSKKKISLDKIESNDPAVVSLKVNEKDLKTYGGCKPLVNALVKNTVLSTLDLSENRLGDTSEELFILLEKNQGITNLDVSYNGFSQQFASRIAKEIRKNFTIQHFHLEESASKRALGKKPDPRIREIQQDIDNVAAQNTQFSLCQIKKADTLSFTNRNFRVVPKIIDTVPHITELDLSYNLLSVFPRELTQLSTLERLILNHNQITAIQTTQLPELRNLTELDLSYNLLSEIPFSLNYLPLQVLDVSHNLLATTYCFPNVLFGERGVDITASGNYAALHSQCSIIGRLFFLGDRKSGIFKLISLLEGIQLMHDAFKHIPNEKKNHIRGQQSLHNRSSNIRIDHWFPVSKFSVEKKAKRNQNAVPQRVRLKKITAGRTHSLNRSLSPESGTMGEHVPIVRAATCTDTRMIPQYRKSGSLEGFISSSPPSIDSSYVCHQLSCWLFDPVTVHIHPLFVSGSHNHIPFVIAFQLTQNIQEMTDSVMYLIQSIYSTTSSKNPTFFLVGTYKQDFEKRRKIAKSVFNNVKQLFANKAKLFFMSVNLQTCHKVKELSTQIIRELSAQAEGLIFPQLPSVISEPWFERCKFKLFGLYEHINAIREDIVNCLLDSLEIEKSVLRWLEFSKLCREFSFPKEEHELVATLLRHVGTIHHYRDVDGEKSFCDFIFLQPDVLVHHYTKILQSFSNYKVSLHENSVLCAISKATIVQDIWTLLPKTFHEPFLELYEYYGQLFCIHDDLFLVAGDFQPLPNNFAFDQFPEWKSGMGELGSRYITRCYSFDEMNDVGYCKIVTAFHRLITKYNVSYRKLYLKTIHQHSFDIELREVDKTGLEIHCQGLPSERVIGFARVNYDYTRSCVTLFADEISEQREFFCAMAEALESLFSSDPSFKRSKEPVHAMCVCSTCRSEQSKLHRKMWTSLSWLESIAEAGTAFAYCGDLAVRIDLLAPDITLSKVTNKVVEYSSLNIIQKIGAGAHSTVFYATKGKKEVAVKKLFTSADETYSSFRKEVSLMAGLRNPNCVGLVGVCKQPLCVLTEYCLFGDLFSYIESRRERNLPLPIPFILDVLIDVAKGMRFLHSTSPPVLHRDLKSPNILLCRTAPDEEQAENPFPKPDYLIEDHVPSPETAKVADFGLSLQIHGAITKREVDNPLWLAPELLAKEPYSLASDVYAFGIVISEMFSLQIPYETYSYKFVSQLEDYIISGGRPDIAENTPQSMKDLIEKCWHTNAKERPSFQDIVVRLEEIHEEFPTLHKSSTWSETKVKEFKRGAASTKKKRNRKQERRKYSKDIIDTLLKDEELEYLILSHSPTSGND